MPILHEDDMVNNTADITLQGLSVRQCGWLIHGLKHTQRGYNDKQWPWGMTKVKEIDQMIEVIRGQSELQMQKLKDSMKT